MTVLLRIVPPKHYSDVSGSLSSVSFLTTTVEIRALELRLQCFVDPRDRDAAIDCVRAVLDRADCGFALCDLDVELILEVADALLDDALDPLVDHRGHLAPIRLKARQEVVDPARFGNDEQIPCWITGDRLFFTTLPVEDGIAGVSTLDDGRSELRQRGVDRNRTPSYTAVDPD